MKGRLKFRDEDFSTHRDGVSPCFAESISTADSDDETLQADAPQANRTSDKTQELNVFKVTDIQELTSYSRDFEQTKTELDEGISQ